MNVMLEDINDNQQWIITVLHEESNKMRPAFISHETEQNMEAQETIALLQNSVRLLTD